MARFIKNGAIILRNMGDFDKNYRIIKIENACLAYAIETEHAYNAYMAALDMARGTYKNVFVSDSTVSIMTSEGMHIALDGVTVIDAPVHALTYMREMELVK